MFRLIPGLENAEFVRYGVMHRNTFINSPLLLDAAYRLKKFPNIYFAGQITGVEGYVESASSGLVAGINASMSMLGEKDIIFPKSTAIGALSQYISNSSVKNFQPMNVNFGLVERKGIKIRDKRKRNYELAIKALEDIKRIMGVIDK